MKDNQGQQLAKRIGGCLSLPLICFIAMFLICKLTGASLFVTGLDNNVDDFFKNVCYYSILCFAVSINLHTGRMGFDVGSIIVLSTVAGFIADIECGDNVLAAFAVSIAVGTVLSLISGVLYIVLRLPSMIVSLGTTLIYEAVAYWIVRTYAYNGNVEMLSLKKELTPNILTVSSNIPLLLVITVLATALMVAVFHYSKLGYDYRALQTGQKISVDTGINEIKNAIGCYLVSGVLLGAAGIVNYSYARAVQPSLNFGTVSLMFDCFCPLFFGMFLMKFVNKQVGILLGVIGYSFIQVGLGQIQVAYNWNNYVIPLINAAIFVLFMIYQTNEGRIHAKLARKGA